MNLEQYKKEINKIPDKFNKLPVRSYVITDDYLETGNIQDELTFHKWEFDDKTIEEEISLLFFKGFNNYRRMK